MADPSPHLMWMKKTSWLVPTARSEQRGVFERRLKLVKVQEGRRANGEWNATVQRNRGRNHGRHGKTWPHNAITNAMSYKQRLTSVSQSSWWIQVPLLPVSTSIIPSDRVIAKSNPNDMRMSVYPQISVAKCQVQPNLSSRPCNLSQTWASLSSFPDVDAWVRTLHVLSTSTRFLYVYAYELEILVV